MSLPHVIRPICPARPERFPVVPRGPDVYVYSAHKQPELYGAHIVDRVRRALPALRFRLCYSTPPGNEAPDDMPRIYAECFIGLRLTPHDGLPNTVIELGAMGRRSIWNGDAPGAIPWQTEAHVVAAILEESRTIGATDAKLAAEMRAWLDDAPRDWLEVT